MTLAIHPLLLFWKSLASITRINNVRSENFILNFQGWLLFNYQCSCLLSLCDSLFIISHLQSLVNNFLKFFFVVSATTRIIYHNFKGLSTTLLNFFDFFNKGIMAFFA